MFYKNKSLFLSILLLFIFFTLNASDRTDALDLLALCEKDVKLLEVSVKNFGEKSDLADFEKAVSLINLGKIRIAQTKYLDAKASLEEYQRLQYNIYKNLATIYIKRTEELQDEIAVDLATSISNEKILKNFEIASNYLNSAKQKMVTKHYYDVVVSCRMAKKTLFSNYDLAGKKLPEKYKKDFDDCNNVISN